MQISGTLHDAFACAPLYCYSKKMKISEFLSNYFEYVTVLLGFTSHWKGHMMTFPSVTGGGRPWVPLCALFQAAAGILVEPMTFHKLA